MNALDKPVASKVAKAIRMLSSSQDGDVIVAWRAIIGILASVKLDIHALADQIEKPNGASLSESEMKAIDQAGFDRGYVAGIRDAENKRLGTNDFIGADGLPSWHEMALFCQQKRDRLRSNEQEFIDDMAGKTVWREPTEKQQKWLKSIFLRLGGKI